MQVIKLDTRKDKEHVKDFIKLWSLDEDGICAMKFSSKKNNSEIHFPNNYKYIAIININGVSIPCKVNIHRS